MSKKESWVTIANELDGSGEISRLEDLVDSLRERIDELQDFEARYCAVMDTINCDFEDMFPDWGNDEA